MEASEVPRGDDAVRRDGGDVDADSRSWNMDLKISEPETQDLGTRVPNLET